jgi:hypothetical protein
MLRTADSDGETKQLLVEAVAKAEGWAEGLTQVLALVRAAVLLGATEQLDRLKSMVHDYAKGREATSGSMPADEILALCEAWTLIEKSSG